MKRIIVFAPHTDDGESGCGGTISRFLEEGDSDIYYVCFSFAEKSIPGAFGPDATHTEVINAVSVLGIPSANLILFDHEVREFPAHRQEILEEMFKLNVDIKPDIVFVPSSFDIHQDHSTVYKEGVRAFKKSSILGYESTKNSLAFRTGCYVFLEGHHLAKKIAALRCYESQAYKNSIVIHEPLARIRGFQCGALYAECFEAVRWMIK